METAKWGRLYVFFISRVTRFIPDAPRPQATCRSPLQDACCISSLPMTRPPPSDPGRNAIGRPPPPLTLIDAPACQTLRPAMAAAALRWIGRRKPSRWDAKSPHNPGSILAGGVGGQRRAWAWTRAGKSWRAHRDLKTTDAVPRPRPGWLQTTTIRSRYRSVTFGILWYPWVAFEKLGRLAAGRQRDRNGNP
jgi:hypothetical protein